MKDFLPWACAFFVRTSNVTIQVLVRQTLLKNCTKNPAAHATQLFFLNQPIKSLIFGTVVALLGAYH